MQYDIITGGTHEERPKFFTIGNLIDLCLEHPEKTFRFLETDFTVGYLHLEWHLSQMKSGCFVS